MYIFKPTTTGLLLVLALVPSPVQGVHYQVAVAAGLAFSLIGDVFLMLPQGHFVAGLASFLLAHIAYFVAFTTATPLRSAPAVLLLLGAISVLILRALWPNLGKLRGPVLLYCLAIVLMVWKAWGRRWANGGLAPTLAALGASLFLVSDGLLATDRFHHRLPYSQTLIMTTYVVAQALIAASVSIGVVAV